MKVNVLQKTIEELLEAGGCDTPAFDALCLLEDIGGIGRGRVAGAHEAELSDARTHAVLAAAKQRACGYPLQYLLGTWDFLNLTLEVGEGVLIPRPETELLCQIAAECLCTKPHKNVLDLCAGSGCVGLGIASLCPSVSVTAIELSDQALVYLNRNCTRYSDFAVTAVKTDVLTAAKRFTDSYDAIVSNPPYIPASDLATLQREVQHEPRMALDGEDGYRFYRAIAQEWFPKLKTDGFAAVEIGIGQAKIVADLFWNAGASDVIVYTDFAGIERVVLVKR